MATIAITLPKNLRAKLGEAGAQEFVAILNQINTAQLEEMERLNGRTFEKFQHELTHTRELLSNQIERLSIEFDKKVSRTARRSHKMDVHLLVHDYPQHCCWLYFEIGNSVLAT